MRAAFPDREGRLSMWEEEGWASAQWLTDAMTSCGAALTRRCIEAYLNRPGAYTGHGLLTGGQLRRDPARSREPRPTVSTWLAGRTAPTGAGEAG